MSSIKFENRCHTLGDCADWLHQSDPDALAQKGKARDHGDDCRSIILADFIVDNILHNSKKNNQSSTMHEFMNPNKEKEESKYGQEEIISLRKRLKELKEENEIHFPKRRKTMISNYANMIGAYEYGLMKISKLTDLKNAPDNVMDGNNYCIHKI